MYLFIAYQISNLNVFYMESIISLYNRSLISVLLVVIAFVRVWSRSHNNNSASCMCLSASAVQGRPYLRTSGFPVSPCQKVGILSTRKSIGNKCELPYHRDKWAMLFDGYTSYNKIKL